MISNQTRTDRRSANTQRIRAEQARGRARPEHTTGRARRATAGLMSARTVIARQGSAIGAKAVSLAPDVGLNTPLQDLISLPLRTVQGLHAIAGAALALPAVADSVGDLNSELVGLRADLQGMPADSRRLADDVEIVQGTLRVLIAELADVKSSVAPVHGDLARVEAGLAPLPDQLDRLLPKVDDLGEGLDEMRIDLTHQLNGLRTDLSGLPFVSKSS